MFVIYLELLLLINFISFWFIFGGGCSISDETDVGRPKNETDIRPKHGQMRGYKPKIQGLYDRPIYIPTFFGYSIGSFGICICIGMRREESHR